eukprot:CAMPEP_0172758862 /NCGR_PEP_ID=MMETSP1074-20121228/166561_1 /TAXON_ID=2916 /ORGANISM="Ceratium fusus, Strain PA161109" /LENGTH=88 /DNA_ID=CAMNT_0013592521 /DNA_START=54 /DNA_END=317 /DNA_ORIENTATION=-
MEAPSEKGKTIASTEEVASTAEVTTVVHKLEDGTHISYRAASPPPGLYKAGWCGENNVARGGLASITAEHVRRYAELGFLVVEDAFSA